MGYDIGPTTNNTKRVIDPSIKDKLVRFKNAHIQSNQLMSMQEDKEDAQEQTAMAIN